MLLIGPIVARLAQSWKRRTGVLWALITLLLEVAATLVLYAAIFARRPSLFRLRLLAWGPSASWGIAVALGVGLIMALVVATLPMPGKGGGEQPQARLRPVRAACTCRVATGDTCPAQVAG